MRRRSGSGARETSSGFVDHEPFVTDTSFSATHDPHDGKRERVNAGGASNRDWPSVNDILAAQGVRLKPKSSMRPAPRAPIARPQPTAVAAPAHWRMPLWFSWASGSAAAMAVGLVGVTASWTWSVDDYNAGVVAQRLATPGSSKKPLPKGVVPTEGSWWKTSATHLVQWAAYIDRNSDDAVQAEEARALLERAAQIAPLNPAVRYTLARPVPGEKLAPELQVVRSLGQTRDIPALAWAGHQLLAAGKTEPALRAYRTALEMAARLDPARSSLPPFLDESRTRRYALPTEELLTAVIRDMAASTAWSYREWSSALPRGTAAAVVAARVLRDSGSSDAPAALDAAIADAEAAIATTPGPADALRMAAGAEAFAMKQRWADARDRYRQAIDAMPIDAIRRAWWLNVADLSSRLNEDMDRQKALEAAKVADVKDEVTRRAVDLQKASGAVVGRSSGRVAQGGITGPPVR